MAKGKSLCRRLGQGQDVRFGKILLEIRLCLLRLVQERSKAWKRRNEVGPLQEASRELGLW